MCQDGYSVHSLPGWEPVSVGFHVDDGAIYHSSEQGIPTGQSPQKGDTIRCSLRGLPIGSASECQRTEVLFYHNGTQVSSVVAAVPPGGFYGAIGMMSKWEKITLSPPVAVRRQDFEEVWSISTPQLLSCREDGVCVYTGSGDSTEHSIASVRTKTPINPLADSSQHSFALRILNQGEKGYIAVGVVNNSYPTHLLPGWEDTSVGYHADTGDVFQSSDEGHSTSQPCRQGDLMECSLCPVDNSPKQVKVLFFRNGSQVLEVTAWTPKNGFYFCFGMMSRSEEVQVILPDVSMPYEAPKLEFEDVWEVQNPYIQHRGSGVCYYVGADGVGTVRSKHPIDPFSSTTSSFEVKILEPGSKCYIALGVCSQQYSTSDLPGWDDLSVGFHADSGGILQKSAGEESVCPPCGKGDVIRCTLKPIDGADKQMSVVFHKNGKFVGKAIFWKPGEGKVFAQVGCMSAGEVIQIASPLQKISPLKPDFVAAAVAATAVQKSRQQLTFEGQVTDMGGGVGGGGAQMQEQSLPTPQYNPQASSHDEEMQRLFYSMYYHHMHHPRHFQPHSLHQRGGFVPPGLPFLSGGFRHGGPPPQDYTQSFPPPAYSDQLLQSQLSEPAFQKYGPQTSSSSSASDQPTLFSSQTSSSSLLSVDTLPGNASTFAPEKIAGFKDVVDAPPFSSLPHPSAEGGQETTLQAPGSDDQCVASSTEGAPSMVQPKLCSVTLQRSSSIIVEPDILSKEDSKMFKILHNAQVNNDGSLQYAALCPDAPQNSFIMFRLPLSEKLNYFQAEISEILDEGSVALGLVWDHYPVYHLPGLLEGSVAIHTSNSTLFGGKLSKAVDAVFAAGDIIGCRAALCFKSETLGKVDNYVRVEFFRNGLPLCAESIFLPPNGFFPAIGLTGFGTKVVVNQNIQLSPLSYFDTHPYPLNFSNFAIPVPVPRGWQCLQNAKMEENLLFIHGMCCGQPSVVQSGSSFSTTSTYFQVQLHCDVSNYSVLSIGASPKLCSDSQLILPGETPDSVAFLPLLGFVMSKRAIANTIPEVVGSDLYKKNTTVGVGVEFMDAPEEGLPHSSRVCATANISTGRCCQSVFHHQWSGSQSCVDFFAQGWVLSHTGCGGRV